MSQNESVLIIIFIPLWRLALMDIIRTGWSFLYRIMNGLSLISLVSSIVVDHDFGVTWNSMNGGVRTSVGGGREQRSSWLSRTDRGRPSERPSVLIVTMVWGRR